MKTAYELAMERLNKAAPTVKLSPKQKAAIGALDSKYKAKIAEREIALKDQLAAAVVAGDFEKVQKLERDLADERRKLLSELEEKKETVRRGK